MLITNTSIYSFLANANKRTKTSVVKAIVSPQPSAAVASTLSTIGCKISDRSVREFRQNCVTSPEFTNLALACGIVFAGNSWS